MKILSVSNTKRGAGNWNWFVVGLLMVGMLGWGPRTVLADYQSARAEYQRSYSTYRDVLVEYEVARSEYLTYQTIVSRSQAIFTTKEMLFARNLVIKNYMEMLSNRWSLANNNFLTSNEYAGIESEIESLQKELVTTEPLITNAEELPDLVAISKRIDTIYRKIMVVGYRVQGYIVMLRARGTIADATDVLAVMNEQVDRIQNEGLKSTTDLERGLIDAEALLQLATQNHTTAENDIKLVRDIKLLDGVRNNLRRSRQYIKSMSNKLLEVTSNIKIAD